MIYSKGFPNSVLYCCGGALLCGGYALVTDFQKVRTYKGALTLPIGIIALLIGPNCFLIPNFRWSPLSLKISGLFIVMSAGQDLVNLAIPREGEKKMISDDTPSPSKNSFERSCLIAKKVSLFVIGGLLFGVASRNIILLR